MKDDKRQTGFESSFILHPSSFPADSLPYYDAVPYESTAATATNPDTLVTVAPLRGLAASSPDRCRILELGCAEGGNLLPLALALPGSTFIGVDLSRTQIQIGQKFQAELGVANLELRHASILDVDDSYGTFDYILCHGVYSWVAPPIQDRMLDICRRLLTSNGVAYVSYNVYPGWGLTGVLRETLRYHVRDIAAGRDQVRAARDFVVGFGSLLQSEDRPYTRVLREDLALIARAADPYLAHEFLEEDNRPVYFHQFVEHAGAHGLSYLGETSPATMIPDNLRPEVSKGLKDLARDPIHLEQLMDLLRGRSFRNTLLCHADVTPANGFTAAPVPDMFVASPLVSVMDEMDPLTIYSAEFRTPQGEILTTNNPVLKTALICLAEAWPWPVPFASLWATVATRLGRPLDGGGAATLADHLLRGYLGEVIELHAQAPRYVRTASERPMATALARAQARRGAQVTNRRHVVVALTGVLRLLLSELDGQSDRQALRIVLEKALHDGQLSSGEEEKRMSLEEMVDVGLERLAEQALLVG